MATNGGHGSTNWQLRIQEQLETLDADWAQERSDNSNTAPGHHEQLDPGTPAARRAIRLEAQVAVGVCGI
jgi:hypothetical protein